MLQLLRHLANRVDFKVGNRVNLLVIHDDVIVAIAKIISNPGSGQLHNMMQPEEFLKSLYSRLLLENLLLWYPTKTMIHNNCMFEMLRVDHCVATRLYRIYELDISD